MHQLPQLRSRMQSATITPVRLKCYPHLFARSQYYVTGNLTDSLYTEDCLFKDPTTTVKGTGHR